MEGDNSTNSTGDITTVVSIDSGTDNDHEFQSTEHVATVHKNSDARYSVFKRDAEGVLVPVAVQSVEGDNIRSWRDETPQPPRFAVTDDFGTDTTSETSAGTGTGNCSDISTGAINAGDVIVAPHEGCGFRHLISRGVNVSINRGGV